MSDPPCHPWKCLAGLSHRRPVRCRRFGRQLKERFGRVELDPGMKPGCRSGEVDKRPLGGLISVTILEKCLNFDYLCTFVERTHAGSKLILLGLPRKSSEIISCLPAFSDTNQGNVWMLELTSNR